MIRIDTATQAGPSALFGGDTVADGDFLAVLAALVGGGERDAETGVLLPGSPLLEAADDLPEGLLDTVTAPHGDETDETAGSRPWLVSPALAALLARPAVLSDTSPLAIASMTSVAADDPTAPVAEVPADTNQELVDLPETDGQPTGGPSEAEGLATDGAVGLDTAAALAADGRAATAATDATADEAPPTDRVATTAAATTTAATAARTSTAVDPDAEAARADLDAAAESDTGPRGAAAAARNEASAEPRTTSRVDAVFGVGDTMQADEAGPAGAGRERVAAPTVPSTIGRLLDALERLERMPPPRQVVLELGEVRVRLGLEDGAVRMQVLGEDRGQGRDLLRAAEEALRERGFELAGDRSEGRRERPGDQQRPDLAPPRPGTGHARAARPAERPTGADARTAIHL